MLPPIRIYINIIVTQMIQSLLVYYHSYANKSVSLNCQQHFPNFTIYNKTCNKEIPVDTFTTIFNIPYKFIYTLEKY